MTGSDKQDHPKTLEEAVERLLNELPEEEINALKGMTLEEVGNLHFGLGMYIRNNMGLYEENSALMLDCCPNKYKYKGFMLGFVADGCSMIIIEALWKRLQEDDS